MYTNVVNVQYITSALREASDLFANSSIADFYVKADPLASAIIFSLLLSAIVIVLAEITGNYSQVDRLWSLLPAIYVLHFAFNAYLNGYALYRLLLASSASALWSARLTFNYWRKGGYEWHSEDYRWPILRTWVSRPVFFLFNITFIGLYQNILLLWVSTPAYLFYLLAKGSPIQEDLSAADFICSGAILAILAVEYTADQQQWDFQGAKASYKEEGTVKSGFTEEEMVRGFVSNGLWGYSRHPNFLAEQLIWAVFYAWGAIVSEDLVNWTIVGALSYSGIFQGSTWLTEKLSSKKYPEYKEYQKHVPRFFPHISCLWKGSNVSFEAKCRKEL